MALNQTELHRVNLDNSALADASGLPVRLVDSSVLPTAGGKTITYVVVNQGAAGTTELAAASALNKHKVIGCVLTMSAVGTLKFVDSSENLTGPMDIGATGGFVLSPSEFPFFETKAINRSLSITTTGGAARGVVAILTEP